jgi:hypothetical protein
MAKTAETTITFYFGVHKQFNLDTPEIMTEQEFIDTDPNDFTPNLEWTRVTVANETEKEQWIAAKNAWIAAAWTPNQNNEEREENAIILEDMVKIMKSLNQDA